MFVYYMSIAYRNRSKTNNNKITEFEEENKDFILL